MTCETEPTPVPPPQPQGGWLAIALLIISLLVAWQDNKPPVPVDPDVPPGPVDPIPPDPDANTLPLRVLIVTDPTVDLPTSQDEILLGTEFRKAITDKHGTYQFVPTNADFSQADKRWQDIWASKPEAEPSMTINTGGTGGKGPLPLTTKGAIEMLNKYSP